jgi:hypothetical protein
MSYCTNEIIELASDIYSDLDSPSFLSVGMVSGWITNSGSIGSLNIKLGTSVYLSGDQPCMAGFGGEEAAIYSLMYQSNFYEKEALKILRGGGSFWTSISEGDTKISRANVRDISKAYLELHKEAEGQLRLAIQDWKRKHSTPEIVDSAPLYGFPTP